MIKDGKFVCSDFPQYEIKLGMLNGEKEIGSVRKKSCFLF